jgi:hypothetical protein
MDSVADYCNNSILELWSQYLNSNSTELIPLLYNNIERNCILFVGLNPSFNKHAIKKRINEVNLEDHELVKLFQWKNYNKDIYYKAIKDNEQAVKKYHYYDKFKEIAITDLSEAWQHIDLFYFRETRQSNISNKIFTNKKVGILNQFADRQIQLTWNVIKMIDPKIIVVQNILASKIFKKRFKHNINNYENIINSDEGYETIKINNSFIPIFFSGMLTGQRALDTYSYFRLRWHIKKAYNKL